MRGIAKHFRKLTSKLVMNVRPSVHVNSATTARWGSVKFRIWDCYKNLWTLSEFNPSKITFTPILVYVL